MRCFNLIVVEVKWLLFVFVSLHSMGSICVDHTSGLVPNLGPRHLRLENWGFATTEGALLEIEDKLSLRECAIPYMDSC